jgi:chaperone required for assembly of F1-ATPase
MIERAFSSAQLWSAVSLDELWQEELWGEDALAIEARAARKRDWDAAVRFLELLG